MDKMDMETKNIVSENVEKISSLFPNTITETTDRDGNITKKIDFDVLKQELSDYIVEGDKERYVLTWPGKKQAILLANKPINDTLRPCKQKSINFDKTKNLYIEGDNLNSLKLIRETYLGRIDVVYIDPPYNTGDDFIYDDDFLISENEYLLQSNQITEEGIKLSHNSLDNGRFHTDWLNMIYPRLKVAKDIMSDNGVIFVSINDSELYNLKKIMDEIFGSSNFVANFIRKTSYGEKTAKPNIDKHHDYLLCYAKQIKSIQENDVINGETKGFDEYSNPDNDPRGAWKKDSLLIKIDNGRYGYARYPITNPYLNITHYPPVYYDENNRKQWHYIESTFREMEKNGQVVYYKNKNEYTGEYSFYIKKYKKDVEKTHDNLSTLFLTANSYSNANGTNDIAKVFGRNEFKNSYPKPVVLVKDLIKFCTFNNKDCIVLDFFGGSGTTGQSVMELNAEDGGHRRYILIQLPESTKGNSEYKTISELGKERVRLAGEQIKKRLDNNTEFDGGFRFLKLDSSNMKDVYYNPSEYTPDLFSSLEDNIKEDRTDEDLLFQVMLDLGIMLDSKIEEKTINGKKIFVVTDEDKTLICCFDKDVTDDVVTEIAKSKPDYAVFRDSSMSSDSVAINFEQIFKTYSPSTTRKVL